MICWALAIPILTVEKQLKVKCILIQALRLCRGRTAHRGSREIVVVCFLPGNSPASEFYMPTFRNTLSVPSS